MTPDPEEVPTLLMRQTRLCFITNMSKWKMQMFKSQMCRASAAHQVHFILLQLRVFQTRKCTAQVM